MACLVKQVGQSQVRPLMANIQAVLHFPVLRTRCGIRRVLDFMRLFKLQVDARASCAGEVLLQKDEQGVDHPIGYF